MTQQQHHFDFALAVDTQISDDFRAVAFTPRGDKYQDWYAQLLTAAALLAFSEKVVYVQTEYEPQTDEAQIVIFTTSLVIIAKCTPDGDVVPVLTALPRNSLTSLKLSASERIDAGGSRLSHEWPGVLNFQLTYRDRADAIEIVTARGGMYRANQDSPIVTLIKGLPSDLAAGKG